MNLLYNSSFYVLFGKIKIESLKKLYLLLKWAYEAIKMKKETRCSYLLIWNIPEFKFKLLNLRLVVSYRIRQVLTFDNCTNEKKQRIIKNILKQPNLVFIYFILFKIKLEIIKIIYHAEKVHSKKQIT